jgi:hypothetical protein
MDLQRDYCVSELAHQENSKKHLEFHEKITEHRNPFGPNKKIASVQNQDRINEFKRHRRDTNKGVLDDSFNGGSEVAIAHRMRRRW